MINLFFFCRYYEFVIKEEDNSILLKCQLLTKLLLSFVPFPTGQDSCKCFLSSVKQRRTKSPSATKMPLSFYEN